MLARESTGQHEDQPWGSTCYIQSADHFHHLDIVGFTTLVAWSAAWPVANGSVVLGGTHLPLI